MYTTKVVYMVYNQPHTTLVQQYSNIHDYTSEIFRYAICSPLYCFTEVVRESA